jgi:ubiquinone/menaquinone biosynthesis C-methylase UbiE
MTDHQEIYRTEAVQYDALVSREDYHGHILEAINQVIPLAGLQVVEFGAGTGRLTRLLAPVVQVIRAFDRSAHMLSVAGETLRDAPSHNWSLAASDHRQMAVREEAADLVISGWSICYVVVEHAETWPVALSLALEEMHRVVRPGGILLLLETLGTGVAAPDPPANLLPYYAFLAERGFMHRWMRTDYRFQDWEEARRLVSFFFGEAMVQKIQENEQGVILPECTGLWWTRRERD